MPYEPSFRDRLDRMRVLTVERGHTSECAQAMTYTDAPCSCGKVPEPKPEPKEG